MSPGIINIVMTKKEAIKIGKEIYYKSYKGSDILPPLIEVGASCSRILTNPA